MTILLLYSDDKFSILQTSKEHKIQNIICFETSSSCTQLIYDQFLIPGLLLVSTLQKLPTFPSSFPLIYDRSVNFKTALSRVRLHCKRALGNHAPNCLANKSIRPVHCILPCESKRNEGSFGVPIP